MNFRWIVFSDLDGTLLEHSTYAFEPALPALRLLSEKKIPLVLCSSKTRSEIERLRLVLSNADPFVSENGGAVFIPRGYFSRCFSFHKEDVAYLIIELGTPYPKLREVFGRIQQKLPGVLVGFGDLTVEEIVELSGLSPSDAELAAQREYDEPFMINDLGAAAEIRRLIEEAGLRMTRGGRFHHLTGRNDKGLAVRILKMLYAEEFGAVRTLGLGDSLNDLPLLEEMDYPVLVQRPGGDYDPAVELPNLSRAPAPGPEGWSRAVLQAIAEIP
ncbi:MAG: HAD-IIB family hydrolase [Acidobacteriota bacterium]